MKTTPVKIFTLNNVRAIAAGGAHALADNNQLCGWGFNFTGQVGNGLTVYAATPTEVHKNFYYGPRSYYRLAGDNRFETAVNIAKAGWNYGTRSVVLTRADDFPDALTGTPLAYMLDAPILLTHSQTLSPETKAAIEELQPTDIYILGSNGAVSEEIERQLSQSYGVKRLGGKDRYETSAQIAQFMWNEGFLDTEKAVIAYGGNFPDALAVSSLAAYKHIPILLTETYALPSSTQVTLQKLGVKETIIVGGTGVVSPNIENAVPNPTRYSGADRYMTGRQ